MCNVTIPLRVNCSYVGKTKPIGVRFDEELLNKVKGASLATSPQKALNLYERSYVELIEMKVAENNKPENKARIEAERNPPSDKKPFPTLEELAKRKKDFEKRLEEELPFNTTKSTNQPNPPTTLDELKALCPHTDKDERRIWVATERQKYGI